MSKVYSLERKLSKYLSNGTKYTVFNAFNTKKCVGVIHKPKHDKPLITLRTTHFCILFNDGDSKIEHIPLLAIEIYVYHFIYSDKIEKMVYVSKADTTGLTGLIDVNVGGFVTEFLSWCCMLSLEDIVKNVNFIKKDQLSNNGNNLIRIKNGKFVSETQHGLYILEKRASGDVNFGKLKQNVTLNEETIKHYKGIQYLETLNADLSNITTKLVLFTRSENQYLFPNSIKNDKHVLNDRSLLKWWLKNVERVTSNWANCKKFLNILNSETREIARFLPTDSWQVGNVYNDNKDNADIAIYNIPMLPDDPKGRFLEHLVVEGRSKKVKLGQYWQELGIRQEFSFGAVVGLIGVEGKVETVATYNDEINVKDTTMKQIQELVTSKDYNDSSDWSLLYNELRETLSASFTVTGTAVTSSSSSSKRTMSAVPAVPAANILSVRKRAKVKQPNV